MKHIKNQRITNGSYCGCYVICNFQVNTIHFDTFDIYNNFRLFYQWRKKMKYKKLFEKISILAFIVLFSNNLCYAFTIEDIQVKDERKIIIGNNSNTDWIEVGSLYKNNNLVFEDLSAIQQVDICQEDNVAYIYQNHAIWRLHWNIYPSKIYLKLQYPELEGQKFKTIYKRYKRD